MRVESNRKRSDFLSLFSGNWLVNQLLSSSLPPVNLIPVVAGIRLIMPG